MIFERKLEKKKEDMVTAEFKEIITIKQGYAVLPNLSIVLIKAV